MSEKKKMLLTLIGIVLFSLACGLLFSGVPMH